MSYYARPGDRPLAPHGMELRHSRTVFGARERAMTSGGTRAEDRTKVIMSSWESESTPSPEGI